METEEEQVEQLKAWLKENGLSIVFGIIIGVGGIGGYKYWNYVQDTTATEASAHFSKMIDALDAGNYDSVQTQADALINDYASTDYALMAQLALAKSHVVNGNFDKAEQALQQVVGSGGQKPLSYVARTRLAALQIQNGKIDLALGTLNTEFPDEFSARVGELRGDAYATQGKAAEAIAAYRNAQSAKLGAVDESFLRQKIDDLGVQD
ncbi:MAG: tetratricopeptide repeat protein [Gammaproteobacteria bacterium]|nr:tetratricopeptide repeat protein [Gammaproteobacteria bacterium]